MEALLFAPGLLLQTEDYGKIPRDAWDSSYVGVAAQDGWGIEHRSDIDRIEIDVQSGPFADVKHEPARRVRANPGARTTGDGWVWWEARDAVGHVFEVRGP